MNGIDRISSNLTEHEVGRCTWIFIRMSLECPYIQELLRFDGLNLNKQSIAYFRRGLSIRCRICLFTIESHCLWEFAFGTCFVMQHLVFFLGVQFS